MALITTVIDWYSAAKAPAEGGLPFRDWNIEVYLVGDKGETLPATIFDRVTYHLHPSFDRRAKQSEFMLVRPCVGC